MAERKFRQSRCVIHRDPEGSEHYVVEREGKVPSIDAWWNRGPRHKLNGRTVLEEHICIRQDSGETNDADVIVITHGQAYDLIDALTRAIEHQ